MDEQEKMNVVEEVKEIEKEIKYKIITLEDDKKTSNAKEKIDSLIDELNRILSDFTKWCQENNDPEHRAARKEKIQQEIDLIVSKSKEVYHSVKDNEEIKAKIEAGAKTVMDVAENVYDSIESTVQDVLDNPKVSETLDTVAEKLTEFKNDERVQEGINNVRKGTLKMAESAFEGLKKVLKADDFKQDDHTPELKEIASQVVESTDKDSE